MNQRSVVLLADACDDLTIRYAASCRDGELLAVNHDLARGSSGATVNCAGPGGGL